MSEWQNCLDEGLKKDSTVAYLWQQKAMPYFKLRKCEIGMPYVVVGNWNANEYGMKLYHDYSKVKNIILYNPIYEMEELNVLRSNCFFYLHGHSAGGTNPSLVEAMYLGLPVIAYGVNYNRETTFGRALFFNDFKELKTLLFQIQPLNSTL